MMDVDFVQRIMREKSCPSEKIAPPRSGSKGKQRRFRSKYNCNNGKNEKDPRDLLASTNDQFNDPEYLNEIGYHLQKDIEKIKKEVIPLRQRLHIFMKMEENAENLPPEAVTLNILDPQPKKNVDVSQRANQLNITISELDSQLRTMQKYYCEKTKVDLKNDISIHQEEISDLNMKIDCMKKAIQVQNKQREDLMNSKERERIDHLNEKINKLSLLLSEMKEEQKEDIENHFKIVCEQQANPILQNQLSSLQRQLHSLQYIKAQRQVELNKQIKRYEIMKRSVSAVIDRKNQSSKNSLRNAKMSKRFTRELYENYNRPVNKSNNRIRNQHSSSSDYSVPENEPDNAYKRKIFKTNKDQTSDEQSDIYYLEDVEVQTKEIDFNSLFNNNFGPESGKRFRHHRRKIRKHPRHEQEIKCNTQNDEQDEEIEIDYNFPTNIQFLQFPSSSRKRDNNSGKAKQVTNTSVNTDIINSKQEQKEIIKPDTNYNKTDKTNPEIDLTLNDNRISVQVDISNNANNNKSNNMDTTEMIFHSDDNDNQSDHSEYQQIPSQIVHINTTYQTDANAQETPRNVIEDKNVGIVNNTDSYLVNKNDTNGNEPLANDNENDTNNSGIRISASFAENAINILGHSKFVSDTEEEEFIKDLDSNNANNIDDVKKEEILNAFNNFPRPRDLSFPKIVHKAEYSPEVIICEEEELNDSKNESDPFSFTRNDLPCPSLSMKGSSVQTINTGP